MTLEQELYVRWRHDYARQTDEAKRRTMLEAALLEDADHAADHALRAEMAKVRYADPKADGYIRFWMEALYTHRSGGGLFAHRRLEKNMAAGAKLLFLDRYESLDESGRQVVEEELLQMMRLYLKISLSDSKYASQLYGMMKMSDGGLRQKVAEEFLLVTRTLPQKAGMAALYAPLDRAAKQAYCEAFADGVRIYEGFWEG